MQMKKPKRLTIHLTDRLVGTEPNHVEHSRGRVPLRAVRTRHICTCSGSSERVCHLTEPDRGVLTADSGVLTAGGRAIEPLAGVFGTSPRRGGGMRSNARGLDVIYYEQTE